MSNKIKINSWMKMILIELQGKTLTRKLLIERAAKIPKYSRYKQAEMFISRNIFSLTRQGLLLPKGKLRKRTYYVKPVLRKILNEEGFGYGQEDLNILLSEKRKVTNELNLLLSEIVAYQELHQRLPSKKLYIESLLKLGKERSIVLNGKLKAINNVLDC